MPPRHDPWAELRDEYVRMLRAETGATEDVALKTASVLVRVFQERFGGERLYVPRPRTYDPAEVLKDFTGDNAQEVMRKYGLLPGSFYRLLKRSRKTAQPLTPPASNVSPQKPRPPPPRKIEFSW